MAAFGPWTHGKAMTREYGDYGAQNRHSRRTEKRVGCE